MGSDDARHGSPPAHSANPVRSTTDRTRSPEDHIHSTDDHTHSTDERTHSPTDHPHSSDDRTSSPERLRANLTRRRVLQGAAVGTLAAVGRSGAAQQEENRIELGGEVAGWVGRVPGDIEDETNPTLELQAGTTYVLEWENVDGLAHNVVIEDADGEPLVASEIVSGEGETQTVEFEATEAMAEYYCEVHPQSMRGQISIEGQADGAGAEEEQAPDGEDATQEESDDEEGADDEAESAGFFTEGAEVGVRSIAAGMTAPTDAATTDDGRLFVTDQTGELWIVDEAGADFTAFDDVDGGHLAVNLGDRLVGVGESFAGAYADPDQEYDERGLLGVALHPEFDENGRLFLHYSAPPTDHTPEGWSHVEVVSEFQLSGDGESVDPDSERTLMEIQSPQYNHDGGPIAFGPDGYLYVPMGDGGGANDSMAGHVDDWYDENEGGNGQDTTENALGGVHRVDVDDRGTARGSELPYAIPEDNPLVDEEGHIEEYYAWGFRNPFGITFDADGQLIVADAGQNLYEEASVVERGGNYGWNVKEGTHCFSTESPGQPPDDCPDATPEDVRGGEELRDPIVEYPHSYEGASVGIVIAGGHVYEADEVEALQGKYVFGDWTRDVARQSPDGRLFAAQPRDEVDESDADDTDDADGDDDGTDEDDGADGADATDEVVPREELWAMEELVVAGSEDGTLGRFVRQFGQGPDGEVYVLVNQRGVPEGTTGAVLELVPPGEGTELEPPAPPQPEDDVTEESSGDGAENGTAAENQSE